MLNGSPFLPIRFWKNSPFENVHNDDTIHANKTIIDKNSNPNNEKKISNNLFFKPCSQIKNNLLNTIF